MSRRPAWGREAANEHTQQWTARRESAWKDHIAGLDTARAERQQAADDRNRQRSQSWSDWHAAEADRQARRDGLPTARERREQAEAEAARQQQEPAEQPDFKMFDLPRGVEEWPDLAKGYPALREAVTKVMHADLMPQIEAAMARQDQAARRQAEQVSAEMAAMAGTRGELARTMMARQMDKAARESFMEALDGN